MITLLRSIRRVLTPRISSLPILCGRASASQSWRMAAGAAVLLLAAAPPAASQATTGASGGLRLGALYAAADRANPRITAADALATAAQARVPGSRRPPDPQLQLGFMNRSLPGLGPMDIVGMTQLQVMQMVPTGGKLGLAGEAAAARATGAHERATDIRWDVRERVAAAFYDVYRTERSIAIALETRRLLDDVASTSESMYRVGEATQADVLKARVEIARMTEEIVAMRAMRLVNLARLGGLLDQPVDSSTALAVLPAFPDTLPSADSLMHQATVSRPMVRAGEADLTAAQADTRRAWRELWPDLQVGVQYGQRGGMDGVERMASLMVGASIPVFAKSRQLRMRDEADAMQAMASADLKSMRADTRARVGEVHVEWVRARNLSALYRTTILPQARAAVTASLAAYRVGQVNVMTLLDNQMTVNRYTQELAALEAAEGMALADLEMLLGRELFDPNTGRPAPGGDR
ncbi:MAG TPA: TolC family protein [Gemmatimonadaceae bacterium]